MLPDRAEIARLLETATPGPWEIERCPCGECNYYGTSNGSFPAGAGYCPADAALIALAPALARAYVEGPLGAEAMKQAAAQYHEETAGILQADDIRFGGNVIGAAAAASRHRADAAAILALPSRSPGDLLTAALALVEVRLATAKLAFIRPMAESLAAYFLHRDQEMFAKAIIVLSELDSALAALNGGAK